MRSRSSSAQRYADGCIHAHQAETVQAPRLPYLGDALSIDTPGNSIDDSVDLASCSELSRRASSEMFDGVASFSKSAGRHHGFGASFFFSGAASVSGATLIVTWKPKSFLAAPWNGSQ